MIYHKVYIDQLVSNSGPDPEDYSDLDALIIEINNQVRNGELSEDDIKDLVSAFGESLSEKTMQGFTFSKPHGYAGDFEIIDRIYNTYISDEANLTKWDIYWQQHTAAKAVRNRNQYFNKIISSKITNDKTLHVLNLASGPGRDMYMFFKNNPDADIHIDCIEQDINAINHAKKVCVDYLDKMVFHQQNALKLKLDKQYDLIWSAGLFDYFNDKVFCRVLRKLKLLVVENGEIIIGNFSTINPSKAYMELLNWTLEHRSPQRLKYIAHACDFNDENISVKHEEEGVNLFLHLKA